MERGGLSSCAGLGCDEHMGTLQQKTYLAPCKPLVQPLTQAVICKQQHDKFKCLDSFKQL